MNRLHKLIVVSALVAVIFGCSSDPETPLGTEFVEDGLIGVDPGDVFQDTVLVASGDTSFLVNSTIPTAGTMEIGRRDGFESALLMRFDFSAAGTDTNRIVLRAQITLDHASPVDSATVFNARIYALNRFFEESDTLSFVDFDPNPIPDDVGGIDRSMRFAPRTYNLPIQLVQDWIRGNAVHNGVTFIVEDTTTTLARGYGTREAFDEDLLPFLRVDFTDGTFTNFDNAADGTFVRELSPPTSELRLSDGATRRIKIPVDLSTLPERALLHDAEVVYHVVPGSVTTSEVFGIFLYAAESDDVSDSGVLTGPIVSSALLDPDADRLVFPVRVAIENFLTDPSTNNGFVLRYTVEGASVKRVDFYDSSAPDSLRPSIQYTFSETPDFRRP